MNGAGCPNVLEVIQLPLVGVTANPASVYGPKLPAAARLSKVIVAADAGAAEARRSMRGDARSTARTDNLLRV